LNKHKIVRHTWIVELETKINSELKKKFPNKDFRVDLQGEYEILKELDKVGEKTIVLTSEVRIIVTNHFGKGTQEEKIQASKIVTEILSGV
jgi:hypothetical protein